MTDIALDFQPRDYQLPLLEALEGGVKRAVAVWHRRAGKDLTAFNWTVAEALRHPGNYWIVYPTYAQGRKAVWLGRDKTGRFILDYIPKPLVEDKHDTDMRIRLVNSSLIQVVGADNVDNLVGANLRGCVLSEYAIMDPRAWQYLSPILVESKGWVLWIYTPRGRNHGYTLFNDATEMAKKNPGRWFCQRLTVDDTGMVTEEELDEERATGMTEEMVQQEYYCSWIAFILGSYFGRQMQYLDNNKRFREVPWDPSLPVHTAWDLGVDDATAIWFAQRVHNELRLIDYCEGTNLGLTHYSKFLRELPYTYGVHLAPHDIRVRELSTGQSRLETAGSLGIDFDVVKRLPKPDQIDAARKVLPLAYFDAVKCERGIQALQEYAADYDVLTKVFKNTPRHDWTSHAADAFQILSVGIDQLDNSIREESYDASFNPYNYEKRYITEFNPLEDPA